MTPSYYTHVNTLLNRVISIGVKKEYNSNDRLLSFTIKVKWLVEESNSFTMA